MSKRILYESILFVSYHRHLLRNILDNNYRRSYLQVEISLDLLACSLVVTCIESYSQK